MRSFLIVVLILVLIISIVSNAILYSRLSSEISQAQSQITTLQSDMLSLQSRSNQNVPAAQAAGAPVTMVDLIAQIQPIIVRVDVKGPGFTGSGSGIIIRNNGYIITNQHVIDQANSISVLLSTNQQLSATVTSSDSNIDLAILKLSGGPSNLPVATLGTVSDIVIGGIAVAAGFPLGSDLPGPASFTQGIVSAIRTIDGQRYVQSDVQINPGNSGGALINRNNGRVIGITAADILPQNQDIEGIGLAIPIDVFQTYIQNNLK